MSTTDLERAGEQSSALALKNVPVPSFLAELGVRFAFDEATNARLVMFPPAIREKLNVIDPVSSLVQADPNWTPRLSVAQLDPDAKNGPHFYEQAGRKLAPTKQALEVLGKAAGILYTRTNRISKTELDDGEIGYRATLGVRRSDGTVEEISREKIWVGDAERAEIEDAVTRAEEWKDNRKIAGSHKFGLPGDPEWAAEVQKRWLKELKDRSAKTESKAVLRAIRAALQIPHTFTAEDAAKPFLVVGFNFTPDYNDEQTKRMLVAAGLNAQASMYGTPALAAAPVDSPAVEETVASTTPPADESQQAPAASVSTPPAAAAAPGADASDEAAPTGEKGYNPPPGVEEDPKVVAAKLAAKFVPPTGVHAEAGRTLEDISALGADGKRWFGAALRRRSDLPEAFNEALWAYVIVYEPEIAEQFQGEQGTIL